MSIAVQPKRVILDATSNDFKLHGSCSLTHTHIGFQIFCGVVHAVDFHKFAKPRGRRGLLEVHDVVFFEPSICEEFNSLRVEGLWRSF